jgi:hypothetical protein
MHSLAFSPIVRRSAVIVGLIASTVACSDEATAPKQARRVPPGISAVDNPDLAKKSVLPPDVDGIIAPGEYKGGVSLSFQARVPAGLLNVYTPVTVHVTRDQTYLYLAATFDRQSPVHPADRVSFEFDNDNDGVREDGDDILLRTAQGTPNVAGGGGDYYRFNNGMYNQSDAGDGGTLDALSSWGAIGTKATFEIRQPLDDADDAHDISILGGMTIGMQMMVALEKGPVGSGEFLTSFHPSSTTYCQLTVGDTKVTSVSC